MIQVLEKNVADKIAAGEVIERPASIIKELVENSIDAGASSITIEIKNGGKTYIRVTDDGCGIPSDEILTAFKRHATSKISKADDLLTITSLGFRGEALASIAAVTRTSMVTKEKDKNLGCRIEIDGGEVISKESVGCPDGTTVIATDLFFNTPARREFLKNDAHETSVVTELVSEIAFAYPEIRMQLINNGNTIFSTTGDGDLKNTVISVFRKREYRDLFVVSGSLNGYNVTGCISRPSLSRSTRKDQVFCVNGRVVESKVIEKGIRNGYRERLFEGRYPVVFLKIDTDPASIDVNIHPNKKEIRFHDEQKVIEAVSSVIIKGLMSDDAVISASDYFHDKESVKEEKNEQVDVKHLLSAKRDKQNTEAEEALKNAYSSEVQDVTPAPVVSDNDYFPSAYAPEEKSIERKSGTADLSDHTEEKSSDIEVVQGDFDLDPKAVPFDFDDLRLTGCIFETYLTCEDGHAFYLIDQHAAHERVNYEKFVGEYLAGTKTSQTLLTPVMIDVDPSSQELSEEWMYQLKNMGFLIEPFGPDTYIVKEIPAFMDISEAEGFVEDYIESLGDQQKHENKVVIDKLITKSCKASVKAHDHLSYEEAESLLEQLKGCRNPFSCPHGRPTFIRFTQYQIEKFFKRTQ